MQRKLCYKCGDYQILGHYDGVVTAYQKPKQVVMIPAYINKEIEGKRKWMRIGLYCPACGYFEPSVFKPKRHAV